ncbi:hypothetical protein BKA70DRAFT_1310173, partial [Coprinopsis sp. MPI-PUGE-AT-0042]
DRKAIIGYLWQTTPTPTILSVSSFEIFWILTKLPLTYVNITHLNLNLEDGLDLEPFRSQFPDLKSLAIETVCALTLNGDPILFLHTNLQSLILLEVRCPIEKIALFLEGLPSLQEFKVSTEEILTPLSDASRRFIEPRTHTNLGILVVGGEDILSLLYYLVAPSLRFFGIHAWGSDDGPRFLTEAVAPFFQRSRLSDITISIKGFPKTSFLVLFTQILPPGTRLHLSIDCDDENEGPQNADSTVLFKPATVKEIFCPNLRWLKGGGSVSLQSPSVPIYTSSSSAMDGEAEAQRDKLKGLGYELQVCSPIALDHKIWSILPPMTIEWDLWEEFRLIDL